MSPYSALSIVGCVLCRRLVYYDVDVLRVDGYGIMYFHIIITRHAVVWFLLSRPLVFSL